MRQTRPLAAVAAAFGVLLTNGCAGHFPVCPAAGGPGWHELTTAHFRLWTDLDAAEARATLAELEEIRASLLTCFRAPPDVQTGRVSAIVLAHGWGDLELAGYEGLFLQALFQPFFVLRARSGLAREQLIRHELVHFLSHKVAPEQPPWYAEGLATYFETIEYDDDKHQLAVGRPPQEVVRLLQGAGFTGVQEMLSSEPPDPHDAFFYPSAWLIVHYLMNHHASQLREFQAELQRAPSQQIAWAAAFPGLTPAALDAELRRYLDGGRYSVLLFPFLPPAPPVASERALSDADVHAVRGLLSALASRHRDRKETETGRALAARADHELAEARRSESSNVFALAIAHWVLGNPTVLSEVRLAVQTAPRDWMAWALLADALSQEHVIAGQAEAMNRAIELSGDDLSVSLTTVVRAPLPGSHVAH